MSETKANATLYAWNEVVQEQLNPKLARQFVTGEQAMFARIELKQGCLVPTHAHANEQIAYVASGALVFRLGYPGEAEQVHTVRAGEVLVIPANLPHSAEALEDTVDFDLFAPPRQDWIDKDDSYLR